MTTISSSPSYTLEYMDSKYDVASFFLVESSGDSEGDFGFSSLNDVQDEEDDAESCCWGSSSDVDCMEDCSVGVVDADQGYSSEEHDEDSYDDKHYHHSCKLGDGRWISQQEMRLMDDGSSSDESMQSEENKQRKIEEEVSEEEKNRMFWEKCLAL